MEKQTKKFYISLALKALIILIGLSGIILTVTMGKFMISFSAFLYFTIQSNLAVVAIAAIFSCLHYREFIKGSGDRVLAFGQIFPDSRHHHHFPGVLYSAHPDPSRKLLAFL